MSFSYFRNKKTSGGKEFPLWHSGLKTWHCLCGGMGSIPSGARDQGSGIAAAVVVQVAAAAWIQPLAQELPHAEDAVKKKSRTKYKNTGGDNENHLLPAQFYAKCTLQQGPGVVFKPIPESYTA